MNAPAIAEVNAAETRVLVTIATNLNQRLGTTVTELARTQEILRQASDSLMSSFRSAASLTAGNMGLERVQQHLNQAVQDIQSHDLVNQLIDAQKMRVQAMREKLQEAIRIVEVDQTDASPRLMDAVIVGLAQLDDHVKAPSTDAAKQGSVDLF